VPLINVPAPTVAQQLTGPFNINISALPAFQGSDAATCGAPGTEVTHRICGAFTFSSFTCGNGNQVIKATTPLTLTTDAKAPPPPVLGEVAAQDRSLVVPFTVDSEAAEVQLEFRALLPDAGVAEDFQSGPSVAPPSVGKAELKNLINGTTYQIRAVAVDSAKNISDFSIPVTGKPIATDGFFEIYRNSGGAETGGCSTGLGGLIGWVSALGVWALVRRWRQ
jgi:hypothetical protein